MRIISGRLKGKNINFLKNSTTRPLKDVVKENIFNILDHSSLIRISLKNAKVLDAYSGVGSFGLECLSRGANKVSFVENNKNASMKLKENLKLLDIKDNALVFDCSIELFLKKKKDEKYSLIFLDPPYSDNSFVQNISIIKQNKMYEQKHIVIIHREKNTKDNLSDHINIMFSKKYGRSEIFFGVFT